MAELTPQGLIVDRFPEIIDEIEQSERELISPNIYTRPDELLGQFNSIMAERFASLNMLAEAVNDAFNINKAEGKSLDDLAALRGVVRISATFSSGMQMFVGANGTTVPQNTVLMNSITRARFITTFPLQLTPSSAYSVLYEVTQVEGGVTYSIFIGGQSFSYVSEVGDTTTDILSGIASAIDAVAPTAYTYTINNNTILFQSTSTELISAVSGTTYLRAVSISTPVNIRSEVSGPVVATARSIDTLVTPISGITQTYNPQQLALGRNEESDEELRLRIPIVTNSGSTGTVPSIRGALLSNVAGISSVNLVENVTNEVDSDGRPPKTYEVIVVGGTDEDIAEEVWRTKPTGIQVVGNTTVIITDSNNTPRLVQFTRPLAVSLAVRVTYTLYNEELFPVEGNPIIQQVVLDYIVGLGVDKDVIPSRMFGPIYNAVGGIDDLVVEIQEIPSPGSPPNPANWQTTRLPISIAEFANSTLVDIVVAEEV